MAETQPPGTPDAAVPTLPLHAHRRFYVSVAAKFIFACLFASAWTGAAIWLSLPWIDDLTRFTGPWGARVIVGLIAYLPGFVVAFMSMSLILDRQPPLMVTAPNSAVTIIVAARNEEAGIGETLLRLARSDYAGELRVILADNGSSDQTVAVAVSAAASVGLDLRIIPECRPGKSNALNTALIAVDTPCVITVDADTLLHREALRRLMCRLESSPKDTVAVAGTVLVRNSRTNLLTRMQEWDYYLGIAAVKRMQGLYQATLVAQGAFSAYRTEKVRAIGGWPDAIGEDIVVTWKLLQRGGRVVFEPTAVAFTDAPDTVPHFMRQRARWARGMFEGLTTVPPWKQPHLLAALVSSVDYLIPLLDIGYALIWLPGLVLFLFGFPAIVSAWALTVIPVTLVIYGGLRYYQRRRVFEPLGLGVRSNLRGYLAFLLGYQVLCSIASLAGYAQFLAGSTRRWK